MINRLRHIEYPMMIMEILNNKDIKELEQFFSPMMEILNSKNIIDGINIIEENDKVYCCFEKDYLSSINRLLLMKISYIYSETIFYSDNVESPNSDRLEYWCPDDLYDEKYHVTERCKNKKLVVLQLNRNDKFTILGTTIMLANILQEQDPLQLKINQEKEVFTSDEAKRHQHYISMDCPDRQWLCLNVFLNKDNPLNENFYAPLVSCCEINSPVECDNIILSTFVGCNEKKMLCFNMDKEQLQVVIQEYLKSLNNEHDSKNIKQLRYKG